jgi:hypothetical protein
MTLRAFQIANETAVTFEVVQDFQNIVAFFNIYKECLIREKPTLEEQ